MTNRQVAPTGQGQEDGSAYIRVNHHPDHLAVSRIHGRRDTMLADGDTEFDHNGEATKALADSAVMRGYDCVAFSSRFMLVASLQTLLESS